MIGPPVRPGNHIITLFFHHRVVKSSVIEYSSPRVQLRPVSAGLRLVASWSASRVLRGGTP
jgi:hypothetical protein